MRKFIQIFLVILFLLTRVYIPQQVHAQQSGTQPTRLASLPHVQVTIEQVNRAKILEAYLNQYNSPLAPSALTFIKQADANNLDWKLVVAISGVESGFGQALPNNSYNAWGFGIYGSNVRYFESYDDGITIVSTALRTNYINRIGSDDVYAIGSIYAADPMWAVKVSNYMNSITTFEQEYNSQNLTLSI